MISDTKKEKWSIKGTQTPDIVNIKPFESNNFWTYVRFVCMKPVSKFADCSWL